MISYLVQIFFSIIYLIIFLVVILSWIPVFDIRKEPVATLIKLYNRIMTPFKSVIPPIGMIDISPLVAFIVIKIIEKLILNVLAAIGI